MHRVPIVGVRGNVLGSDKNDLDIRAVHRVNRLCNDSLGGNEAIVLEATGVRGDLGEIAQGVPLVQGVLVAMLPGSWYFCASSG